MKKKGFTLIELLAVIVVLAIIALIATPMVLNTIDEARKGSAKSSGYGYISGVETSLASYMLRNNGVSYRAGKYDVSTLNEDLSVTVKGDAPSEGKVCVSGDGTVTKASLKVSGYIVSYDGKEVKNTDKKEVEDITCDEVVLGGPTQLLATNNETYKAIVYLDPTDLTKTCEASNSVSTTGTKEGCMKWYAYSDDGTNYTMILDHNTTEMVAWNSEGTNAEMKEIKIEVDNLVSIANWKVTPRLMTADEIAQISGNTTFNGETAISSEYFYFENNSTSVPATFSTNYAWLYDYTTDCIKYGCNIEDLSVYGYWTSTPVAGNTKNAWRVLGDGNLSNDKVEATSRGVRPVITVSKDIFK